MIISFCLYLLSRLYFLFLIDLLWRHTIIGFLLLVYLMEDGPCWTKFLTKISFWGVNLQTLCPYFDLFACIHIYHILYTQVLNNCRGNKIYAHNYKLLDIFYSKILIWSTEQNTHVTFVTVCNICYCYKEQIKLARILLWNVFSYKGRVCL